jgi:hypothetical protein
VHSKTYPYLRRESWYLIITEESLTGLAAVEKLDIEEDEYTKEFQERITRPGPIKFISILANDSYKGLDQLVKCEVNVIATDKPREEI